MSPELTAWKNNGNFFNNKGNNVFYMKEDSGEVLFIFHGYPYSSFDFKDVWQQLTLRFSVILPDMLGMGFSDKPQNYQ